MTPIESASAVLAKLVAINSVNPDLVPGAAGEGAISNFCARWLGAAGFEVHRLEAKPGRPSIVGIARGKGGGKSLMFNGHIDTVTLAGYDGDPLAPEIRDGKLYGRGAFDMKSGVAAMMVAAERAKSKGLAGDILVACVADEEYASEGTAEVLRHFSADAAVVTEPSHLELTLAHKGFVWFDVTIHGRAAHGSRPELGIDAIAKAGHFLVALEAHDMALRRKPIHPRLISGSIHASIISGGEELSSYPAECLIRLERRTVPGETPALCENHLREILDRLARDVPDFSYSLTRGLAREPFETDENAEIARAVAAATLRIRGKSPDIRAEPFWTDCALIQAAGIPCVMFGADGGGAHAATEWADLASVEALAAILEDVATEFCA